MVAAFKPATTKGITGKREPFFKPADLWLFSAVPKTAAFKSLSFLKLLLFSIGNCIVILSTAKDLKFVPSGPSLCSV